MIKAKTFQEWALDYERSLHYTQEFLKRNEDYQKDCERLSEEEVYEKWGVITYSSGAIFKGRAGVNMVQSKGKTLTLSINLDTPISFLAHSFIDLIQLMKRAKKIPEKRIQWGMLDIYLKSLDLKKEGKKIDEIARILYPGEYEYAKKDDETGSRMESLERKVKENIRKARDIARGGKIW